MGNPYNTITSNSSKSTDLSVSNDLNNSTTTMTYTSSDPVKKSTVSSPISEPLDNVENLSTNRSKTSGYVTLQIVISKTSSMATSNNEESEIQASSTTQLTSLSTLEGDLIFSSTQIESTAVADNEDVKISTELGKILNTTMINFIANETESFFKTTGEFSSSNIEPNDNKARSKYSLDNLDLKDNQTAQGYSSNNEEPSSSQNLTDDMPGYGFEVKKQSNGSSLKMISENRTFLTTADKSSDLKTNLDDLTTTEFSSGETKLSSDHAPKLKVYGSGETESFGDLTSPEYGSGETESSSDVTSSEYGSEETKSASDVTSPKYGSGETEPSSNVTSPKFGSGESISSSNVTPKKFGTGETKSSSDLTSMKYGSGETKPSSDETSPKIVSRDTESSSDVTSPNYGSGETESSSNGNSPVNVSEETKSSHEVTSPIYGPGENKTASDVISPNFGSGETESSLKYDSGVTKPSSEETSPEYNSEKMKSSSALTSPDIVSEETKSSSDITSPKFGFSGENKTSSDVTSPNFGSGETVSSRDVTLPEYGSVVNESSSDVFSPKYGSGETESSSDVTSPEYGSGETKLSSDQTSPRYGSGDTESSSDVTSPAYGSVVTELSRDVTSPKYGAGETKSSSEVNSQKYATGDTKSSSNITGVPQSSADVSSPDYGSKLTESSSDAYSSKYGFGETKSSSDVTSSKYSSVENKSSSDLTSPEYGSGETELYSDVTPQKYGSGETKPSSGVTTNQKYIYGKTVSPEESFSPRHFSSGEAHSSDITNTIKSISSSQERGSPGGSTETLSKTFPDTSESSTKASTHTESFLPSHFSSEEIGEMESSSDVASLEYGSGETKSSSDVTSPKYGSGETKLSSDVTSPRYGSHDTELSNDISSPEFGSGETKSSSDVTNNQEYISGKTESLGSSTAAPAESFSPRHFSSGEEHSSDIPTTYKLISELSSQETGLPGGSTETLSKHIVYSSDTSKSSTKAVTHAESLLPSNFSSRDIKSSDISTTSKKSSEATGISSSLTESSAVPTESFSPSYFSSGETQSSNSSTTPFVNSDLSSKIIDSTKRLTDISTAALMDGSDESILNKTVPTASFLSRSFSSGQVYSSDSSTTSELNLGLSSGETHSPTNLTESYGSKSSTENGLTTRFYPGGTDISSTEVTDMSTTFTKTVPAASFSPRLFSSGEVQSSDSSTTSELNSGLSSVETLSPTTLTESSSAVEYVSKSSTENGLTTSFYLGGTESSSTEVTDMSTTLKKTVPAASFSPRLFRSGEVQSSDSLTTSELNYGLSSGETPSPLSLTESTSASIYGFNSTINDLSTTSFHSGGPESTSTDLSGISTISIKTVPVKSFSPRIFSSGEVQSSDTLTTSELNLGLRSEGTDSPTTLTESSTPMINGFNHSIDDFSTTSFHLLGNENSSAEVNGISTMSSKEAPPESFSAMHFTSGKALSSDGSTMEPSSVIPFKADSSTPKTESKSPPYANSQDQGSTISFDATIFNRNKIDLFSNPETNVSNSEEAKLLSTTSTSATYSNSGSLETLTISTTQELSKKGTTFYEASFSPLELNLTKPTFSGSVSTERYSTTASSSGREGTESSSSFFSTEQIGFNSKDEYQANDYKLDSTKNKTTTTQESTDDIQGEPKSLLTTTASKFSESSDFGLAFRNDVDVSEGQTPTVSSMNDSESTDNPSILVSNSLELEFSNSNNTSEKQEQSDDINVEDGLISGFESFLSSTTKNGLVENIKNKSTQSRKNDKKRKKFKKMTFALTNISTFQTELNLDTPDSESNKLELVSNSITIPPLTMLQTSTLSADINENVSDPQPVNESIVTEEKYLTIDKTFIIYDLNLMNKILNNFEVENKTFNQVYDINEIDDYDGLEDTPFKVIKLINTIYENGTVKKSLNETTFADNKGKPTRNHDENRTVKLMKVDSYILDNGTNLLNMSEARLVANQTQIDEYNRLLNSPAPNSTTINKVKTKTEVSPQGTKVVKTVDKLNITDLNNYTTVLPEGIETNLPTVSTFDANNTGIL